MNTLIIEDDVTNGLFLQQLLKHYGPSQVAVNGKAAVEAVRLALEAENPYDLIFLDVMMPEMDGHTALKQIRVLEEEAGIWASYQAKVVMTTALLSDTQKASAAFSSVCHAYVGKPIDKAKLLEILRQLALIP
jgi:two-component system, chemotaxis family, chemotaxis protein CheY